MTHTHDAAFGLPEGLIPQMLRATADLRRLLAGVPWQARLMMHVLTRIKHGAMTVVLPDKRAFAVQGTEPGPAGVVVLNNYRALRRVAATGSLGFAEAYVDGDWDSPDVTAALEAVVRNSAQFEEYYRLSGVSLWLNRIMHRLRPNSRRGSQKNIHAHYDLGNRFYAEWLDPSMTYSAACFGSGAQTLEQAQTAKYAALADMIGLKRGDHVLEIGCGWGGFAAYAAKERGAHVTGVTISKEQLAYAQERMARLGVSDQVEIRYQDYRDITGSYDGIASIEMFEAVGEKYWPSYFETLHRVLKPGGSAGLQVITIGDADFESYRQRVDFIQRYIFPGGMLPSPTALKQHAAAAGLEWRGAIGFARDYGRTLAEWRERFFARWDRIAPLGFDERFKRLWSYYFSYCEAGFRGGQIDVLQMKLTKA